MYLPCLHPLIEIQVGLNHPIGYLIDNVKVEIVLVT